MLCMAKHLYKYVSHVLYVLIQVLAFIINYAFCFVVCHFSDR